MGSAVMATQWRMRGILLVTLAVMLNSADGAPLVGDVQMLDGPDYSQDLGESAVETAGESAADEVGEMASYAATKKKYLGLIKKTKKWLKKKKAVVKKKFDAQMKKTSKIFAKLYAPIKKGPSPKLGAPLGMDGQSGISSMARWAFATQVAAWSKIAHKKIARYEMLLQENRFRHFSTAVCKEVLKSKVDAIGDLDYKKKKSDLVKALAKQKKMLNQKVAFDRADMEHKVASYKLWSKNSEFAANGGVAGRDPTKTHMMTTGQSDKMGQSREGELVQAAHWAFARQKAHALSFYDRNVGIMKKRKMKLQKQHDLTLCRTGRKPNSPHLKFELKRAKKSLKKQIKKMPAKAKKKAAKKALKKKAKKAKKAKKKAKKKGEEMSEDHDLGESGPDSSVDSATSVEDAIEFHKLIDSSGGEESIAERASMLKRVRAAEQMELSNNTPY